VTRRTGENDVLRAVRLLESLREDPLPRHFDIESSVARRVRLLPVPRAFAPIVSLGQFGWAAAAAVFAVVVGGIGLLAVLGTGAQATPAALRLAIARAATALLGAASSLARTLFQVVFGTAEGWLGGSAGVDSAIGFAARGALVVCAVMMFLTLLVVLHETWNRTRTRRIAG